MICHTPFGGESAGIPDMISGLAKCFTRDFPKINPELTLSRGRFHQYNQGRYIGIILAPSMEMVMCLKCYFRISA